MSKWQPSDWKVAAAIVGIFVAACTLLLALGEFLERLS